MNGMLSPRAVLHDIAMALPGQVVDVLDAGHLDQLSCLLDLVDLDRAQADMTDLALRTQRGQFPNLVCQRDLGGQVLGFLSWAWWYWVWVLLGRGWVSGGSGGRLGPSGGSGGG